MLSLYITISLSPKKKNKKLKIKLEKSFDRYKVQALPEVIKDQKVLAEVQTHCRRLILGQTCHQDCEASLHSSDPL